MSNNGLLTQIELLLPDIRTRLALTIIITTIFGVASGALTPRGPLTSTETIATMFGALLVGAIGGLLMQNRWASFVIPATYWVAMELSRINITGPTVDGIQLGSLYGVIAFILGRGLQAVIVFTPMILGIQYGAGPIASGTFVPRENIGLIVFTVIVVLFSAALVNPATTKPIDQSNSIAMFTKVSLGGEEQTLLIRGYDKDNPVLLYLAGGPGGTDLGAMRMFLSDLEKDYIVVTWEQRGAGKSYPALDPTETLTLEQTISDTLELTNYLRTRFNKDKIYIVANSWGTIPSVYAVKRSPELYYAYVGTGQMVNVLETDRMFYEDSLEYARETGNTGLENELLGNGLPPYEDLMNYMTIVSTEHSWNSYPGQSSEVEMPNILMVPEYSLLEKLHALPATLDTYSVLYPQIQDVDFREEAASLDVPVYMVIGEYEARGRAVLADEWFELLDAPYKERVEFSNTGHRPLFEKPDTFVELMERIKNETG